MLILTSDGLSSPSLLQEAKKYILPTAKTAAMITTASVGYKEKDWHVPALRKELEFLHLTVDYFDFDTQRPEFLRSYDLIELIGGNPFYLLQRIRSETCCAVLREFAERKVVLGISAGSLVLQKNLALIAQYSPELVETTGLTDFSALQLTNVEILPHYHKMMAKIPRFEERARAYEEKNGCKLIRIDDGQGIFICETKVYLV
jgi:dipeptidase E